MESLIVLTVILSLCACWPLIGWVIVTTMNFISVYLKGEEFFYRFTGDEGLQFPQILLGPLLLVWIFYPVWLGIVYVVKLLRYQFGWKVVTLRVNVLNSSYLHELKKSSPTRNLCNFFQLYTEDTQKRFFTSNSKDSEALTNFLEIDGWRKVSDVLYTKIVRVKDLNKDFKDE
jgi:hypothetical protein